MIQCWQWLGPFWLCYVSLRCDKSELELEIDLRVEDESPASSGGSPLPPLLDSLAKTVIVASSMDNDDNLSYVSATLLTFKNPPPTSVCHFLKVRAMAEECGKLLLLCESFYRPAHLAQPAFVSSPLPDIWQCVDVSWKKP